MGEGDRTDKLLVALDDALSRNYIPVNLKRKLQREIDSVLIIRLATVTVRRDRLEKISLPRCKECPVLAGCPYYCVIVETYYPDIKTGYKIPLSRSKDDCKNRRTAWLQGKPE